VRGRNRRSDRGAESLARSRHPCVSSATSPRRRCWSCSRWPTPPSYRLSATEPAVGGGGGLGGLAAPDLRALREPSGGARAEREWLERRPRGRRGRESCVSRLVTRSPAELRAMGARSRQVAEERFATPVTIGRFVDSLESLRGRRD
jgi:hypothetical protein